MKHQNLMTSTLLAAMLFCSSAFAADYTIDATHSQVLFKIKHLGISTVTGRFESFEGTYSFDKAKPADSKANVTIAAKSINTNQSKRDEHLRNEDFFDVEKFPNLTFVSMSVKALGKDKYEIKGDLTLHGVTKPVVLHAEYTGAAKDPWGNDRTGFVASTTINRKDFGLTWNKALETGGLVVGEEVKIELEIEGVLKK